MTLNSRTALYCTNDASFGVRSGNLKEGRPVLSAATNESHSEGLYFHTVLVDIRECTVVRGPRAAVGWSELGFFFVILVAISSEPLNVKPILLRCVMKYLVGFPATRK